MSRLRFSSNAGGSSSQGAADLMRGGVLFVPTGLRRKGAADADVLSTAAEGRAEVERLAMETVLAAEQAAGHAPGDVSVERLGYEIDPRECGAGRRRFIEVKDRAEDAHTMSVTRNGVLTALFASDAFVLAIAQISNGVASDPRYVRQSVTWEPEFGATSVTYKLAEFLARAEAGS